MLQPRSRFFGHPLSPCGKPSANEHGAARALWQFFNNQADALPVFTSRAVSEQEEKSVSKKSSVLYLVVLLCAVFTAVTVVTADVGVLGQNTNSSTTEDHSMMQHTNTSNTRRSNRGRRGRRRAARRRASMSNASMAADANVAQDGSENTSTAGDVQTDLSGTYTGKLKMSGSHPMEGDGTITISGNSVTIESGGMAHAGRIFAVTTRGYTGVTMYFPDIQDTASNTNLVLMSRARKRGDRLSLTPVPGARNTLTFR
jgi:hypothetical protein